jgi:hypothetical protein
MTILIISSTPIWNKIIDTFDYLRITTVRLFYPDFVRTVYQHEGKIPYVAPLLDTTKQYREQRDMSPGLGNT